MKEIAKLKQLPPVYMGRWASATDEEVQEELAKGTPFTYRFRVPREGSLKINDLIRGEVISIFIFTCSYVLHLVSSYSFPVILSHENNFVVIFLCESNNCHFICGGNKLGS